MVVLLLLFSLSFSCQEQGKESEKKEHLLNKKISPKISQDSLYTRLGKPKIGDWLYHHQEKTQTFEQYLESSPVVVSKARNKIYVLPLGDFDADEQKVLDTTIEYLQLFFGIEIVVKQNVSTQSIPDSSKRGHESSEQIHTRYILYKVLQPHLPKDALIFEALTDTDLYPKPSWNFVFGEAALKKRVAVSSMARFKEYDEKDELLFSLWVKRFVKTVSHETTHAFSIPHCKEYRCLMNGSNSLIEADSRPLITCPSCTQKILWATQTQDAKVRYEKLITFYKKYGFEEEIRFCEKIIRTFK